MNKTLNLTKISFGKFTGFIVCPETLSRLDDTRKFFYQTKKRKWKLPIVADVNCGNGIGYAIFRGKYLGYYYV